MNTLLGIVAACVVFGIAFSCASRVQGMFEEHQAQMELSQAIALLVDNKISMEKNGWNLYRGAKDEYVLLRFDNRASNVMSDTEERFPNSADGRHDAVAKFIAKTSAKE